MPLPTPAPGAFASACSPANCQEEKSIRASRVFSEQTQAWKASGAVFPGPRGVPWTTWSGPRGPEMHLWGLQAPAPPGFFLSLSDRPE